jgi:hypothetical protein
VLNSAALVEPKGFSGNIQPAFMTASDKKRRIENNQHQHYIRTFCGYFKKEGRGQYAVVSQNPMGSSTGAYRLA